jgi:hypothetical protein
MTYFGANAVVITVQARLGTPVWSILHHAADLLTMICSMTVVMEKQRMV